MLVEGRRIIAIGDHNKNYDKIIETVGTRSMQGQTRCSSKCSGSNNHASHIGKPLSGGSGL